MYVCVVKCVYPSGLFNDAGSLRDGVFIAVYVSGNCLSPLWLEFQVVLLT